ncbi:uncharacterized protein LOC130966035 [Arachis stenosperma]|uniref:uncharacterized protein LOC130966035 n=1 Tax=Arachis stenosperma TaxID=217475 RepID=UPI0025ABF46F|nr:uncharacterized protein LOC130966035 [Arachis stenosperma]
MVESERLKFFRCKQLQLRVYKYKCLHESLKNGDVDVAMLGKRIILPSTLPVDLGYPNYFITMTYNPERDGIKREVTPIGLKAEDRPDILCQVFKIKLDGLIDDLKEEKIFGKILGYVCTIEFQKRGLSHAHILLFMSNKFKPQTPDDIDKHIKAEILMKMKGQIYMELFKIKWYISACEAVLYLFGYKIQEKEPFVIRLPFHLKDEQLVVYSETSNVNDIIERAISHKSMFLGVDGGEHVISLCSKSDLC